MCTTNLLIVLLVFPNATGYWLGVSYDPLPYLFIDFQTIYQITKLYTEGVSCCYTTLLNVQYSLDNITWKSYSNNTDGTPTDFAANSGTDTVPIYFQKPFAVCTT